MKFGKILRMKFGKIHAMIDGCTGLVWRFALHA
jgi:hypothetical protein